MMCLKITVSLYDVSYIIKVLETLFWIFDLMPKMIRLLFYIIHAFYIKNKHFNDKMDEIDKDNLPKI